MQNYPNWSEYFLYDESSPSCLRWAVELRCGVKHNRKLVGINDEAGTINLHGYHQIRLMGKTYKAHLIIYEMHFGRRPEGMEIDHIDGNKNNNTKENLRCVNRSTNQKNKNKLRNNTSGFTGVSFNTRNNAWVAAWYRQSDGKNQSKSFSIFKYGKEESFRLACELRALKMKENGYSDRHGK
jgi:hypothetical protein